MEKYIGIRPPYGIMVCRDGSRHKVENTELLRVWVLEVAERIRAARASVTEPIPVHPKPGRGSAPRAAYAGTLRPGAAATIHKTDISDPPLAS